MKNMKFIFFSGHHEMVLQFAVIVLRQFHQHIDMASATTSRKQISVAPFTNLV